jgi:hypothetical protein
VGLALRMAVSDSGMTVYFLTVYDVPPFIPSEMTVCQRIRLHFVGQ